MDADFAAAMARAYNDWLYDFCQRDPNRLIGAGMISTYSMEDAVSEARRCAEQLGFRAIFLRANPLVDHQWQSSYYEPLWDAMEALDLSLGFHESTGTGRNPIGERLEPNFMLRRVFSQPMEQMLALGCFCGGGVLARPPEIAGGVSRSELQLAALAFMAPRRSVGARRRRLRSRLTTKTERLFQTTMPSVHRARRSDRQ
jgi:hypothetical protein